MKKDSVIVILISVFVTILTLTFVAIKDTHAEIEYISKCKNTVDLNNQHDPVKIECVVENVENLNDVGRIGEPRRDESNSLKILEEMIWEDLGEFCRILHSSC